MFGKREAPLSFEISVRGGSDGQIYVEVETLTRPDEGSLKDLWKALHRVTGWYPTRDILLEEPRNGKYCTTMRFDEGAKGRANCELF